MHVDKKGENQLTNFYGISHSKKATESDHAKIELDLDLELDRHKPIRIEGYNLKSVKCQEYFKDITTNTSELSSCFESSEPFQKQIKKWEHKLKSHIVRAFPKIRSCKRKFTESDVGKLLEERKRLKIDSSQDNDEQIANIEADIARKTSDRYRTKIEETMGHLSGDDGALSHHGVWKARNSVIPNDKESRPVALQDKNGSLITNPEGLKRICLEEILKRVRHRKIHPRLLELQVL